MNYPSQSFANALKEFGCQVFLNTLAKIHGAKDLVLSETILIQLDSVCGMQKLRQNAVDKVFKLQSDFNKSETSNRVYVIRPIIREVEIISSQINSYLNKDDDTYGEFDVKFWIIFVPSVPYFCELALEEEGIYEFVSILECPLTFIPLECDLYSLEDERVFRSLYLNKDLTPLNEIVASILQLQELCGQIPEILGQGKYAKIVADRVVRASVSRKSNPNRNRSVEKEIKDPPSSYAINNEHNIQEDEEPLFTNLFLVDRDCDYASVLLSQLNYEGVLDESFNICCNKFEFQDSVAENSTKVKHTLTNQSDPVFGDIRDNHFSTVFSLIKTKNREMKEKYNKSQAMDLSKLKNFVANDLKNLQVELKCLALHISACEEILKERNKYNFSDQLTMEHNIIGGENIGECLDFINKMVAHQLNPFVPLRLLSLLSLTQGGLPPKDYNRYRSSYCENYGIFNNETFDNLSRLGLITLMDFSLSGLISGKLGYNSNIVSTSSSKSSSTPGLSLSSFTEVMSSITEAASGRVANAVSSSVLPRKGNLTNIVKKFQLVPVGLGPGGYNLSQPRDPAFVFGGVYIPLICQLIDMQILKSKNNPLAIKSPPEIIKLLPGPNFKHRQAQTGTKELKDKTLLVYFIGGVTYAEVTALRFLAKQSGARIAIATSSITNGNRLIQSLMPDESVKR